MLGAWLIGGCWQFLLRFAWVIRVTFPMSLLMSLSIAIGLVSVARVNPENYMREYLVNEGDLKTSVISKRCLELAADRGFGFRGRRLLMLVHWC